MIRFVSAKSAGWAFITRLPDPFGIVTSPPTILVLITTGPGMPAAPGWMWAAVRTVPAGYPVKDATKSTFAEVMALVLSRVKWNVIVAVPVPLVSGPTGAGTSLAELSAAVNTMVLDGAVDVGVVLVVGLLLPQPAAQRPRTTARTGIRCMCFCSFVRPGGFHVAAGWRARRPLENLEK